MLVNDDDDDDNHNNNKNNISSSSNNNNNNNRIESGIGDIFINSLLRRELFQTRTFKWSGRSRVQITWYTSGVYHLQHVVYHVVRMDSSAVKFDRV